jgi:hypothetical protein
LTRYYRLCERWLHLEVKSMNVTGEKNRNTFDFEFWNIHINRYARSLIDAKNAGLKKGLFLGVSQAFVSITLYGAIALIFWYGPYLSRVEWWNYNAGIVIIVCFHLTTRIFRICEQFYMFHRSSPHVSFRLIVYRWSYHIFSLLSKQQFPVPRCLQLSIEYVKNTTQKAFNTCNIHWAKMKSLETSSKNRLTGNA